MNRKHANRRKARTHGMAKKLKLLELRSKEIEEKPNRRYFRYLFRVLEIVGFAVAIGALWETLQSNRLTRAALIEAENQTILTREANLNSQEQLKLAQAGIERNQIIQAWQIITTPAPGNSGKIQALEALHINGQTLFGIDLSCQRMGAVWTSDGCNRPTFLRAISLVGADLSHANLAGSDLENAVLSRSRFSFANLEFVSLRRSKIDQASFGHSNLSHADISWSNAINSSFAGSEMISANLSTTNFGSADFSHVDLSGSDLSFADVSDAYFPHTKMDNVNLSNTFFCGRPGQTARCAHEVTQEQIDSAWAWDDQLPFFGLEGVKLDLLPPRLCSGQLRIQYSESQRLGLPLGC